MKEKKEYWLYVEPYCFIMKNKKQCLIFNSLSSSKIVQNKIGIIKEILNQLSNEDNMNCIKINEEQLKNKEVLSFVKELRDNFSGDIIETSLCSTKPIIVPSELKLQKNVDVFYEEKKDGIDILNYLSEISIQINSICDLECDCCCYAYKQNLFCTKNNTQLNLNKISQFLNQIKNTAVSNINILGGNIFSYPELLELSTLLKSYPFTTIFHIHYKNIIKYIRKLSWLKNSKNKISLKVTFPLNEKIFKLVREQLINKEISHVWNFFISSINDYEIINEIITIYKLQNIEIIPLVKTDNLQFFKENIYLTQKDIKNISSSKREIFAKKTLNVNDFGKLHIMSDGVVFANVNHPPLGTIDDSIYNLIYQEIKKGISWKRIRNMKPCSDCIYQWLCPSPSNYELTIGQPNLCQIIN